MLVKTDAAAAEYAVRISSTSVLQNLQGYAILRYPVSMPLQPSHPLFPFAALHHTNQGTEECFPPPPGQEAAHLWPAHGTARGKAVRGGGVPAQGLHRAQALQRGRGQLPAPLPSLPGAGGSSSSSQPVIVEER